MSRYFTDQWDDYKKGTVPTGREIHWDVILADMNELRGVSGGLHMTFENMALGVAIMNLVGLLQSRVK